MIIRYLSECQLLWCVRVPVELAVVDAAYSLSEAPLSPPVGLTEGQQWKQEERSCPHGEGMSGICRRGELYWDIICRGI